MKGILGRKIGMTSVFLENGKNIPVTIIEALTNVVTNVLTNEKNGYNATQLSAFDRRDKTTSKPILGHLKKAKTNGKYFTKEIRDMVGYRLGDTIDSSIFKSGELVDVTSITKGKGFAGSIKRHNQKIGPKSHGGAGGSKPMRLTGGIGDVVSNRVFKGRNMPGQMGNVQRTIQNLEVILVDKSTNVVLVKGSIPGPNKRFVVVKKAVKGLKNFPETQLVDTTLAKLKNKLVEEAKKVGSKINSDMTIEEIKLAISKAKAKKEAKKTAEIAKEKEVAAKQIDESKKIEDDNQNDSIENKKPNAKKQVKQELTTNNNQGVKKEKAKAKVTTVSNKDDVKEKGDA